MNTEQEDSKLTSDDQLTPGSIAGDGEAGPDGALGAASGGAAGGAPAASDSGAATTALPEDYQDLKARAEERDRFLDELKRTRADLENFQKRTRHERPQLERKGARRVLTDLLEVVDNFERALASLDSNGARASSGLEEGVRMIHQQLEDVLRNHGVKEIDALGEPFDPEYHEAVTQEEVEDRPTGEVVAVLQRGYLHHDAVLRPTAVKVALNVADRAPADVGGDRDGAGPSGDPSDAATERRSDAGG